jgi:hypothetical protein
MAVGKKRDERIGDSRSISGLDQNPVFEDGVDLDWATVASGHRGQAVRSRLDENKAEWLLQRDVHKSAACGGGVCVDAVSAERRKRSTRHAHA